MKCDNSIIVKDAKMKGSGKPYKKIVMYFTWFMKTRWPKETLSPEITKWTDIPGHTFEEYCGGNIIADVRAVDEPYFGGSSASLEVEYKCDKCGCTSYRELPEFSSEISKFITEKISEMSEEEVSRRRE